MNLHSLYAILFLKGSGQLYNRFMYKEHGLPVRSIINLLNKYIQIVALTIKRRHKHDHNNITTTTTTTNHLRYEIDEGWLINIILKHFPMKYL